MSHALRHSLVVPSPQVVLSCARCQSLQDHDLTLLKHASEPGCSDWGRRRGQSVRKSSEAAGEK